MPKILDSGHQVFWNSDLKLDIFRFVFRCHESALQLGLPGHYP
jgi:hypothetical protein